LEISKRTFRLRGITTSNLIILADGSGGRSVAVFFPNTGSFSGSGTAREEGRIRSGRTFWSNNSSALASFKNATRRRRCHGRASVLPHTTSVSGGRNAIRCGAGRRDTVDFYISTNGGLGGCVYGGLAINWAFDSIPSAASSGESNTRSSFAVRTWVCLLTAHEPSGSLSSAAGWNNRSRSSSRAFLRTEVIGGLSIYLGL